MLKKLMIIVTIMVMLIGPDPNLICAEYTISDNQDQINIFISQNMDSLVLWAVNDLKGDLEKITGKPVDITECHSWQSEKGIYIGEFDSPIFSSHQDKFNQLLKGEWEKYYINNYKENLLIAGSDIRGTIYGIFEVTERLGISPWKWWADVEIIPKEKLVLKVPQEGIIEKPSVKYRGIFLNDEDWGLQPWAAKNFEPETGDIGPKTYEKIFQLLLRLKANTIWPAMHDCTTPFYQVSGNNEMAQKYHIIVGTSHCEPMMRNNVGEWKHDKYGDYNFLTNRETVIDYWQTRIREVKDAKNIVTVGMRGIHDSPMQGAETIEDRVNTLEEVIAVQRDILTSIKQKPILSIPQIFVPYKEVLELYRDGVEIPDDVTLVWPDDNFGYIRCLSNPQEQKRAGGSGIYYHISYWGSPHDYLWLSTTQPGLIWFELSKAYYNQARKLWIINVGDIKPAEYNTEFAMDLAWDINSINYDDIKKHMQNWATREFGNKINNEITGLLTEYYRLALLRRPEHLGVELLDQYSPEEDPMYGFYSGEKGINETTRFNPTANGNEVLRRINRYQHLKEKVDSLKQYVPEERLAAWFQLIEYPVKCAALMNHKILYAKLAQSYQDLDKQKDYMQLASKAYQQIENLTNVYNNEISKGKWKHMMSMKPRSLPVFDMPKIDKSRPQNDANREAQKDKSRIFIQAQDYIRKQEYKGYKWKNINGLGYSNNAITLLPFKIAEFENKKPWVEYSVNTDQTGQCEIQVRCLPTHSDQSNQKIGIQFDGGEINYLSINPKVRGKEWHRNVLQNHKKVKLQHKIKKAGEHSLKIYANESNIVIDQIAIDFSMGQPFCEIPVE